MSNALNKAVFLDRDGVINRLSGFLSTIDDFELLPGAGQAIKQINDAGYLAIVITNQPVIALGVLTETELAAIHSKLRRLIADDGAKLDDIYYCPHYPPSGIADLGKRHPELHSAILPEWIVDCDCRKPKTQMIEDSQSKWNIDIAQSYMVGDSLCDLQLATNVGATPIWIGDKSKMQSSDNDAAGRDELPDFIAEHSIESFASLYEFVQSALQHQAK